MRKHLIFLSFILITLSISACGKSKNEETTTSPESTAQATTSDTTKDSTETEVTTSSDSSDKEDSSNVDSPTEKEFDSTNVSTEVQKYVKTVNKKELSSKDSIFASDKKYYSEDELKELSTTMLTVFRNEIYARHGYQFQNKNWNTFFTQFSWYKGSLSLDDFKEQKNKLLNKYEKANLARVIEVEENNKK